MSHVALLTPRLRQRWLGIALEQLYETLGQQERELEALRKEVRELEDAAQLWRMNAEQLQDELCALTQGQPGLTHHGQLVVVKP